MNVKGRELDEEDRGTITLVPENLDDLWHLKYVVEPGDLVMGLARRRVEGPRDLERADSGERETLNVEIRVEEVEFHRFSNRLRVSGVIEDCDRETEVGSHHTLNVEVNEEIGVMKTWKPDQLERLEEAEEAKGVSVAVVTVGEGEAYLHTVEEYGVEERASFTGSTGKGDDARPRKELFDEVLSVLRNVDVDAVVLAGPGFTKRDALDYIREREPGIAEEIVVEDTASVGGRGVHEVLKRGVVEDVAEEARVAREARLIDRLMERIADDGAAAYGVSEVERAVEYGAVERLLVVDEYLREERDVVDPLLREVEQKGGDVTVFSSEFEPGKRLENLGGVAALLRYRIGE